MDLLDVNVLVALAWPNHVHHQQAHEWFSRRTGPWATTAVTESGFVRLSSNASVTPGALSPREAIMILEQMREAPGHAFLIDDVEGVIASLLSPSTVVTYRQVSDAHLVAVAMRHRARLVTFDRAIGRVGGAHVTVIPVP